jgi:hypothetical protein
VRRFQKANQGLCAKFDFLKRDYRRENVNIVVQDLGAKYNLSSNSKVPGTTINPATPVSEVISDNSLGGNGNGNPPGDKVAKPIIFSTNATKVLEEYKERVAKIEQPPLILTQIEKEKAISHYESEIKYEPKITQDLKNLAKEYGVEMVGLDFRLKSQKSYLRKVNETLINARTKEQNADVSKAYEESKDNIRYTYVLDSDKYSQTTNDIIYKMQENGYSLVKIKNYWVNGNGEYKGINTNFKDKNGQIFELQFHTKDIFELKTQMHEFYEMNRDINASPEEKLVSSNEMKRLSKELIDPLKIDIIK